MNAELDPITEQELNDVIEDQFGDLTKALMKDGTDLHSQTIEDIALLFFSNGFLRGCMAMTEDEGLKDTIAMMNEEIAYQVNNAKKQ